MENAGPRFQRAFADEPLLERLRVCATDSLSDSEVKKKCQILFRQWAVAYQSTPGMDRIVALQKQLPKRKKPVTQAQSRVIQETEREANEDPFGDEDDDNTRVGANSMEGMRSPTTSSFPSSSVPPANLNSIPKQSSKSKTNKSSRGKKRKAFNLEKEKPEITRTIAESSIASINLMNALKLLNRENIQVSEHPETVSRFETCKANRRQVLRYIQHIETGDLLGGLIQANDQLVEALMSFEVLDKSVHDDSDSDGVASDAEEAPAKPARPVPNQQKDTQEAFSKLSLGKAPAPLARPHPTMQLNGKEGLRHDDDEDDDEEDEEEEEGDNPFGDSHAVHTPKAERPGMTWYETFPQPSLSNTLLGAKCNTQLTSSGSTAIHRMQCTCTGRPRHDLYDGWMMRFWKPGAYLCWPLRALCQASIF